MRLTTFSLLMLAACGPSPAPDSAVPASAEPDAAHQWGYLGPGAPTNWATLAPEYASCASGQFQSPIDLAPLAAADVDAITVKYQPDTLRVVDNGHTVQINHEANSTLMIGEHEFRLLQFHLHSPSEHTEAGKAHDLELHLVHQDDAGNYAVVAVFIDEGVEHESSELWRYLPEVTDHKVHEYAGHTVDPREFLPPALTHYQYHGSLTTPPCTETVTWNVLQTPIPMSAEHIMEFTERYSANARPVQPRASWCLAPHLVGKPVVEAAGPGRP